MIRGLWDRLVEAIIYVKLCNTDADEYKYDPMIELLAQWETIKKDKHGKHYNDQRKHFSPFIISVDNMLGREAVFVLVKFSWVMSAKSEKPLLQLQEWVNSQIAIVVARS